MNIINRMNKRLEVSREGLIWIEKGRENRPAGNQKGKGSLVRFESHYYTKESVTIALSAQDEDLLVEVSSDASRKKESLSIGDWVRLVSDNRVKGVVVMKQSDKHLEVSFENIGLRTVSIHQIKVIATNSRSSGASRINRPYGEIFERIPFIEIYQKLKKKHPASLVIIQNGCYYEVLEKDAELLSNLYGWKLYERSPGVRTTGFPTNTQSIWDDLKQRNQAYIVVTQLPRVSTTISRRVTQYHPEKAPS